MLRRRIRSHVTPVLAGSPGLAGHLLEILTNGAVSGVEAGLGGGPRRFNLALLILRKRLCGWLRLRRRLGHLWSRWRRKLRCWSLRLRRRRPRTAHGLELLERLLVQRRLLGFGDAILVRERRRLRLHLLQSVRRQIQVSHLLLSLFENNRRIDNLYIEQIFRAVRQVPEDHQVNNQRDPELLAQTGPVAAALKLLDDVQQVMEFVILVSSGTTKTGRFGRSARRTGRDFGDRHSKAVWTLCARQGLALRRPAHC